MSIGELIRQMRMERRWSRARLCRETELSDTGVMLIETGQTNPRGETIETIAKAFGVTPGEMLSKVSADVRLDGLALRPKHAPAHPCPLHAKTVAGLSTEQLRGCLARLRDELRRRAGPEHGLRSMREGKKTA